MLLKRLDKSVEFARFPNLFHAGKLRGLFRAVHVTGPGFRRRTSSRHKQDFRRVLRRHQHEGDALLVQIREIEKIVLLSEWEIDVVRIDARLCTEQNEHRFWPDRVRDLLASRRQFLKPLRIVEHRRRRCDSNYGCRRRIRSRANNRP